MVRVFVACVFLALFSSSNAVPTAPRFPPSTIRWVANLTPKIHISGHRLQNSFEKFFTSNPTVDRMAENVEDGLTLDSCWSGSPCQEGRDCISFFNGSEGQACPLPLPGGCLCLPPVLKECDKSSECEKGEVCSRVFTYPKPFCTSAFMEETEDFVEELSPATAPVDGPSAGLGMDSCSTNADCQGERECFHAGVVTDYSLCKGREPCICLATNRACFNLSDCDEGEICAESPISVIAGCISKDVSKGAPGVREVPGVASSRGLNLDSCESNADCAGDRGCSYFDLESLRPCRSTQPCVCLPEEDPVCRETSQCEEGEVCADTNLNREKICVSKTVADRFLSVVEFKPENQPSDAGPASFSSPGPDETDAEDPTETPTFPDNVNSTPSQDANPMVSEEASSSGAVGEGDDAADTTPVSTVEGTGSGVSATVPAGQDDLSVTPENEAPTASQEAVMSPGSSEEALEPSAESTASDGSGSKPARPDAPASTPSQEDSPEPSVESTESSTPDVSDEKPSRPGAAAPAPSEDVPEDILESSAESTASDVSGSKPTRPGAPALAPSEDALEDTPEPSAESRPSRPSEETPEYSAESTALPEPSAVSTASDGSGTKPALHDAPASTPFEEESPEPFAEGVAPGDSGVNPARPDAPASTPLEDSPEPSYEDTDSAADPGAESTPSYSPGAPNIPSRPSKPEQSNRPDLPSTPNSAKPSEEGASTPLDDEGPKPSEEQSVSLALGEDPADVDGGAAPTPETTDVTDSGSIVPGDTASFPVEDDFPISSDEIDGTTEPFIETGESGVTAAPVATPSPTDEGVCIDSDALTHLKPEELVFEKHVWSRVLCDKSGSCATAGHMVVYEGATMMMRTYCEAAGCEEGTKLVNSPKFKKGVKVPSKTEGLEFTAFAARYSTRVEEAVMSLAVRLGL